MKSCMGGSSGTALWSLLPAVSKVELKRYVFLNLKYVLKRLGKLIRLMAT